MSWNAKPKGGYTINSDEAIANYKEVVNLLSSTWTMEAICGLLGNLWAESGMNPWRWQSDKVSLTSSKKGYGLAQFTPAYGYINSYGVNVSYYAPNLSTTSVTAGAKATDGIAQIHVINNDLAGKYINRSSYCSFLDISGYYPISNYKKSSDLYGATVAWLFHYEFPSKHSQSVANTRYGYAATIYEILTGYEPTTPDTSGDSGTSELVEDDMDTSVIKMTPFYTACAKGFTQTYFITLFDDWEAAITPILSDLGYLDDMTLVGYQIINITPAISIEGTNASWFQADCWLVVNDGDPYAEGYVTVPTQAKAGEVYKVTGSLLYCIIEAQLLTEPEYDAETGELLQDGQEYDIRIDMSGYYSTCYIGVERGLKTKKGKSVFYNKPKIRVI